MVTRGRSYIDAPRLFTGLALECMLSNPPPCLPHPKLPPSHTSLLPHILPCATGSNRQASRHGAGAGPRSGGGAGSQGRHAGGWVKQRGAMRNAERTHGCPITWLPHHMAAPSHGCLITWLPHHMAAPSHGCPITWLPHHMRLWEIQSINASHGIGNPAVDLSCPEIVCPHLPPLHRPAWGVPWSNCSSAAGHWRGSCMTRGVRCRCGEGGGGRGGTYSAAVCRRRTRTLHGSS